MNISIDRHFPDARAKTTSNRFRYAKLTASWMLRGWTDLAVVLVNLRNGIAYNLGPTLSRAALACNGKTDFTSPEFRPEHIAALKVLVDKGIVEEGEPGRGLDHWQEYRKAENPFVHGIRWSITGLCNLKCRHCYVEAPFRRYGELPLPEMVRLMDQFERANVCEVLLTGGEPFFRKDFFQILEELVKRKIRVSMIFSNGVLLSEDTLQRVMSLGVYPTMRISFDGCGCHDMMRGSQNIESKVVDAVRRATAAGLKVIVGTCVDEVNTHSIDKTYDLMKALGIVAWRISRPTKAGNWKTSTTELAKEEEMSLYFRLLQRWRKDERPFHLHLGRFPRTDAVAGSSRPGFTHDSFDCHACRKQPFVMADGTILPCTGYIDTAIQSTMPKLTEQEFSTVWTESPLRSILDIRKNDILEHHEECLDCRRFPDCGAGCRARAFLATADLMAKDPVECAMQKRRYVKRFYELVSFEKRQGDFEPDFF